jgi:L-alanine-DL-glutamate epimerase-like enolase superfamily enzyme
MSLTIRKVESFPLRVPYKHMAPVKSDPTADSVRMVLLRVETEGGLVGWGESFASTPAIQRAIVALHEDAVAPAALGRDAGEISRLVHDIQSRLAFFGRGGLIMNAVAALDIALWDIAGRAAGQPLHRLLGGALQTEIPCIASMSSYLDPAAAAAVAAEAVKRGYRRVKIHERQLEVVQSVRRAIGPDIRLMVDVNCHWGLDHAIRIMPALLQCDPYWLEDPIWPPENFVGLRELKARFGVRLAGGGDASTVWRFEEILAHGVLAFAQPDTCTGGGVTEFRRIQALCALKGVTVAPHTPFQGPALLASLHLIAAGRDDSAYAYTFLDFAGSAYGSAGIPSNGVLKLPDGPGLGAEPDAGFLKEFRVALG